jgi:gamma-glutamyl:cysteine ligase YbdK (ATP-grasp superfamily)
MGQEIADNRFTTADLDEFRRRLTRETELLAEWISAGRLRSEQRMAGFELEAWLVDAEGFPVGLNERLLDDLQHSLVVPELATFNLEVNTPPGVLGPGVFETMYRELCDLWRICDRAAARHQAGMLMIGILPTVRQSDLCLENMSPLRRYGALNERIFRLRHGRPVELAIDGRESLRLSHEDVMLEAAATSFQIHLKVDVRDAVRAFNAAKIVSAPMVALAANSPYLFGKDLWDETRIPLFEQAVAVAGSDYSQRVTFGVRYAQESILECFESNRDRYPVLLPMLMDEPAEHLAHLRLHNGTIWRWNRPLIGFSASGEPHLRIEHRVVAAGPSPLDAVANAAFFFGLMQSLLARESPLESEIPFEVARRNFYAAARDGLVAELEWCGRRSSAQALILDRLLPLAGEGLAAMALSQEEQQHWLDIIRQRVTSGRNGSCWQRAWVARHGPDFPGLVQAYRARQNQGTAIHQWEI